MFTVHDLFCLLAPRKVMLLAELYLVSHKTDWRSSTELRGLLNAELRSLSLRTIQRGLKDLKEKGLLESKPSQFSANELLWRASQ